MALMCVCLANLMVPYAPLESSGARSTEHRELRQRSDTEGDNCDHVFLLACFGASLPMLCRHAAEQWRSGGDICSQARHRYGRHETSPSPTHTTEERGNAVCADGPRPLPPVRMV